MEKKSVNPSISFDIEDENSESLLGLNSILSFKPNVKINGKIISKQELLEMLDKSEGLNRFKGEWINIKFEHIKELLNILEDNKYSNQFSIKELISNQFIANSRLKVDNSNNVRTQSFLNYLKLILKNRQSDINLKLPKNIKANLRHYQLSGYEWLVKMQTTGFGVCLADDMGLGKTIQVLSYLEKMRLQGKKNALLVVPASLMSNWQNEINKFIPSLSYKILHNMTKDFDKNNLLDKNTFLYITTYSMVRKIEELGKLKWDIIVLDESQAIKNPNTKQTKAIKTLQSQLRIAMTGTPIENNLGDLWSLFDFINPGLLGSQTEFKKFVKGIKKDEANIIKLRKVINPFILRRLKTDKKIISDLPEKIVLKDYVELTKKQAQIYTKLVDEIKNKIEEAEGIKRKGIILSAITNLKQICNHPSQYLGIADYKSSDSAKFEYLKQICETVYTKRERMLIFTQYTELIPALDKHLKKIFEKEGLILTGTTPIKKRGEIVNKFNGENYVPYIILSLKAGGVGLNLTSANHVIHFDRWWNPAVENQATDRAYRIGQEKNVIVRKIICKGTIEEKIDQLIDSKIKLAESIISKSHDNYLTEMTNDEIMALIKLDY